MHASILSTIFGDATVLVLFRETNVPDHQNRTEKSTICLASFSTQHFAHPLARARPLELFPF